MNIYDFYFRGNACRRSEENCVRGRRTSQLVDVGRILLFAILLGAGVLLECRTASANLFQKLIEAAEIAAKVAVRAADNAAARAAATTAARASLGKSAVLTIDEAGVLQLAILSAGTVSAEIALHEADDLTRLLSGVSHYLFVTPEVLASNENKLTALLKSWPYSVEVVDNVGVSAKLRIDRRVGRFHTVWDVFEIPARPDSAKSRPAAHWASA